MQLIKKSIQYNIISKYLIVKLLNTEINSMQELDYETKASNNILEIIINQNLDIVIIPIYQEKLSINLTRLMIKFVSQSILHNSKVIIYGNIYKLENYITKLKLFNIKDLIYLDKYDIKK